MDKANDNIFMKIKYLVLYALNPLNVLNDSKKHPWFLYLILPAVGWMLFFLQVGIERYRGFMYSAWKVVLITFLGFTIGYIAVGLISWMLNLILSALGKALHTDQVISLIALSHTYMTFSVVLGLIYNLTGNSSSDSFDGDIGIGSVILLYLTESENTFELELFLSVPDEFWTYPEEYYHEEHDSPHIPGPASQSDVAVGVGISSAGIVLINALTKTSLFGSVSLNSTFNPLSGNVSPNTFAPKGTAVSGGSGFLNIIKSFFKSLFGNLRDMLTDEGRSYASGKLFDIIENTEINDIRKDN